MLYSLLKPNLAVAHQVKLGRLLTDVLELSHVQELVKFGSHLQVHVDVILH